MYFRLLGPLVVVGDDGLEIDLARPKLRLLLAILVTRANVVVSVDRLVDEMWGERPPSSARSNLKTYVWALRRLLAPMDPGQSPIDTASHGYLMRVAPESVDAMTFARLVAEARDARRRDDPTVALKLYKEALGLWRGSALQDLSVSGDLLRAEAERLEEARLAAVEDCMELRLAVGDHAGAIAELRSWTAQHPLRERLWEALMLALYRSGAQAAALAVYQRLRRHLVEEMGTEPGPRVQALHSRILNADTTLLVSSEVMRAGSSVGGAIRPRQLPRDVLTFVGRDRETQMLCDVLQGPGEGPRLVVIHGPPGAGKSALAVRVGHRCSDRFPDGQLYVNLRGATPGEDPIAALKVLGSLLRSLGVDGGSIPNALDDASALFRSVLSGRRILMVLDNAADAAQVQPLLPGSGHSVVVITSRSTLATLDGATHLSLGPLSAAASHAMLDALIGSVRTAEDQAATHALARLCDYLPLGLHIAASRLRMRPSWTISHFVQRLINERHRLGELANGDEAVRSSLRVSLRAFERSDEPVNWAVARAFALLGAVRVSEMGLGFAAALFDTTPTEADLIMERLVDAHLIEEPSPNRYQMHDLVRLFANELADEKISAAERDKALLRVLSYYHGAVGHASHRAFPHRVHLEMSDSEDQPEIFVGPAEAYNWLKGEQPSILSVLRQALRREGEQLQRGVMVALAMHWFMVQADQVTDALWLYSEVVAATARMDDPLRTAFAHGCLAMAMRQMDRLEEASQHHELELEICRAIGERFGEQRALGNLGGVYNLLGRPSQAIEYFEQQAELAREIGAEVGQAFAQQGLGKAYHLLGRRQDALRALNTALAWYERRQDNSLVATILESIGEIYFELGDHAEAVTALTRSLECARSVGYRAQEIDSMVWLSRIHRRRGAIDEALTYATEAVTASSVVGRVRGRAAALEEYEAALAASRRPHAG